MQIRPREGPSFLRFSISASEVFRPYPMSCRGGPRMTSDFKFEAQQILDFMEAFVWSSIAEPLARLAVELSGDDKRAVALLEMRGIAPLSMLITA